MGCCTAAVVCAVLSLAVCFCEKQVSPAITDSQTDAMLSTVVGGSAQLFVSNLIDLGFFKIKNNLLPKHLIVTAHHSTTTVVQTGNLRQCTIISRQSTVYLWDTTC